MINKLKRGDRIGIVAPARPINQTVFTNITQELTKRGYEVVTPKNISMQRGYLAGHDSDRAAAFMDLWTDPTIKAIWSYSGGYGSARLLDYLDFTLIRKHPKIFIGMSDNTALHAALRKEANLPTFLGVTAEGMYIKEGSKTPETIQFFWNLFESDSFFPYEYKYPDDVKVLKEGESKGELIGGTLSMICSLLGTPWQMDTHNKILFLEDVNEAPYKVDRMLAQLKQAGLLSSLAGVILGKWEKCEPPETHVHLSLSLEEVFEDYFLPLGIPVIFGFPSGHVKDQITMLLHRQIKLSTKSQTVTWLEDPFF